MYTWESKLVLFIGREKCGFKDPSAHSLSLSSPSFFSFRSCNTLPESKDPLSFLLGYASTFSACKPCSFLRGRGVHAFEETKHLKWFPFKTDFYTNWRLAN